MNLKFALVKQDTYGDLYVTDAGACNAIELLSSSIMRIGPIGLFNDFDCHFFIVTVADAAECKVYEKTIHGVTDKTYQQIRSRPLDEVDGRDFLSPGTRVPQCALAVAPESIDWGEFDIVVSINCSLPTRLIKSYPRTLFAYMMGEANRHYSRWAHWGYDVCLTQDLEGRADFRIGAPVPFPYTFVGSDTLELLARQYLGRESADIGIYSEINMSNERPVSHTPKILSKLEASGQVIHLHQQNVMDNLSALYDSRYFVKIAGRRIRGNSVLEAISAGTLFIGNPELVNYSELIPEECYATNSVELEDLLFRLDGNEELRIELLASQRRLLKKYARDRPIQNLERILERKRSLAEAPLLRWFERSFSPLRHLYGRMCEK